MICSIFNVQNVDILGLEIGGDVYSLRQCCDNVATVARMVENLNSCVVPAFSSNFFLFNLFQCKASKI
jgi:hypothetical protein